MVLDHIASIDSNSDGEADDMNAMEGLLELGTTLDTTASTSAVTTDNDTTAPSTPQGMTDFEDADHNLLLSDSFDFHNHGGSSTFRFQHHCYSH